MRKHGWQLPYHPLQVVAIAVFLALGFAFYVFFVPFIRHKAFQYVVMGLYTPLVTCVFCLYVWCAATNPGDPGIFKSKKHLKVEGYEEQILSKESNLAKEVSGEANARKQLDEGTNSIATRDELHSRVESEKLPCYTMTCLAAFGWCGLLSMCNWCQSHGQSCEEQMSEEGMFYCSLCEVEVLKYSKHCRVCDKCVDGFDHHCRWINNCIGRKNYKMFFILMMSALLLLIVQWSIGILVLILCFLERKQFSVEIISKLGSSFSLVPFIIVVAACSFLAMVATLPLAQLFFFHVLLIKKGISTYDYIIALREQEQEQEQNAAGGQQSPQMSVVSSFTGLSSTSSFNAFHRGAWCTPPRLFLEDQFDVVPPEIGTSVNHASKKMVPEEPVKRKNAGTVKISPWTLARLNAEEVSKAAAQARKKSKILQPIVRREIPQGQDTDSSIGSGSGRMIMRPDHRRHTSKRGRVPIDLPLEPLAKISDSATDCNTSDLAPVTSLAPLQLEARSAFRPNMMPSERAVASSPDSSLDSPDLHPFRNSSSGAEETQGLDSLSMQGPGLPKGIQLSRSTSDGYEASGGEDSDRIPSRIVHRSSNWASIVLSSEHNQMSDDLKASSSASFQLYTMEHAS